jgi:hypothetical protein
VAGGEVLLAEIVVRGSGQVVDSELGVHFNGRREMGDGGLMVPAQAVQRA